MVLLLDSVRTLLVRLAPHGWGELLKQHGLDITANLATELSKPLRPDRAAPGFEDFSPEGVRAIEPGIPARSLLYHALASPLVHPPGSGGSLNQEAYPTLEELDTLENYIFATARRRVTDFPNAVVAVFAYQYRVGSRSPHGLFADLAYSRTGVARVGTAPDNYDRARRSFWPQPPAGGDAISVMPARYAAFLAVRRVPAPGDVILRSQNVDDHNRFFLFPVHKIFAGQECLDISVQVSFAERHVNDKLQRLHAEGDLQVVAGFDVNRPPFIRDSQTSNDLVSLRSTGASVLVVPKGTAPLVRVARQDQKVARFKVPAETSDNRFWSSFQTPSSGHVDPFHRVGRTAPGYVNIRHRVNTAANGTQTIEDLNATVADDNQFNQLLHNGNFEACHFDTCDGCVVATVQGFRTAIPFLPAYSLVTAPDFFPLVDQITIGDWVRRTLGSKQDQFAQGEPWPLSDGRHPANLETRLPNNTNLAFDPKDETMVAVVGNVSSAAPRSTLPPTFEDNSVSFLPEAASNEFEPGWDISLAQNTQGMKFYAAFGLGSPFPEDSKLCAALNSFWPAAAPDATRTFGPKNFSRTAIPLLDSELGLHPNHPKFRRPAQPGWDGEFGPFLVTRAGKTFVNCASQQRSDYVSNAQAGLIRVSGLAAITAREMIARMEALRNAIAALPPNPGTTVSTTRYFLASAEAVADWNVEPDQGDPRLQGTGYRYVFCKPDQTELATPDPRRREFLTSDTLTAQIGLTGVAWKQAKGPFHFAKLL